MYRERRRFARQPVNFYIDEFWGRASEARSFVMDMSLTGLLIERPSGEPPRGAKLVQLEIYLPELRDTIWAAGEIVHEWRGALFRGSGVRFTALANTHARWLRDWLRERARTDRFITHPARTAGRARRQLVA